MGRKEKGILRLERPTVEVDRWVGGWVGSGWMDGKEREGDSPP